MAICHDRTLDAHAIKISAARAQIYKALIRVNGAPRLYGILTGGIAAPHRFFIWYLASYQVKPEIAGAGHFEPWPHSQRSPDARLRMAYNQEKESPMFSSTTKTAAQVTEELAQRDVSNKKDSIKHDAFDKVDKTVDDISDYANKAGTYVRDLVDNAAGKIDETNRMVTQEVRSSPLQSVLIAAGVGFVLGALFRR